MKNRTKRGFTLVELIVVLALLGIMSSLGAWGLNAWLNRAEMLKNDGYAQEIFADLSLNMSSLDAAGQLASHTNKIKRCGLDVSAILGSRLDINQDTYKGFKNGAGEGIIYTIQLKPDDYYLYTRFKSNKLDVAEKSRWEKVSNKALLVYDALKPYIYDEEMLKACITIEFNTSDGYNATTVYSVFYSKSATDITYDYIDINSCKKASRISLTSYPQKSDARSHETRKRSLLGYYSVEDTGSLSDLSAIQLAILNYQLVNDEELYLSWGGNSPVALHSQDVDYNISIYSKKSGNTPEIVLNTQLSMQKVGADFLNLSNVTLPVYKGNTQDVLLGNYTFPIQYNPNSNTFKLMLDSMLDADTLEKIKCTTVTDDNGSVYNQKYNYSITRFGIYSEDIYATIQSVPSSLSDTLPNDYTQSSIQTSNTVNALYGNNTTPNYDDYNIYCTKFRHLSNIRYFQDTPINTEIANKNGTVRIDLNSKLSWVKSNVIMYHRENGEAGGLTKQWGAAEELDFPAIPTIESHWVINGNNLPITNLTIGNNSVASYKTNDTSKNNAKAAALFLTNNGVITRFKLKAPKVSLNSTNGAQSGAIPIDTSTPLPLPSLERAAILTAYTSETGKIYGIDISDALVSATVISAGTPSLSESESKNGTKTVENGADSAETASGISFITATANVNQSAQDLAKILAIKTSGTLKGYINQTNEVDKQDISKQSTNAGIGAVGGYSHTVAAPDKTYGKLLGSTRADLAKHKIYLQSIAQDEVQVLNKMMLGTSDKSILNSATVQGNMLTGGLVGNTTTTNKTATNQAIFDDHQAKGISSEQYEKLTPQISNSKNTGMVLCTHNHQPNTTSTQGLFIGGIAGYSEYSIISTSTSTPVNTELSYIYAGKSKEETSHNKLLHDTKGTYVGGVVGCSKDGLIVSCDIGPNGYILGYDYVGGIAGYLLNTTPGCTKQIVTTSDDYTYNESYVIGHDFVGGIVGLNGPGDTIFRCINRGVSSGYGKNIGGVVGSNSGTLNNKAVVKSSTSYIYDYTDNIYDLVVNQWGMYGDNVGGLIGLNENGLLEYTVSEALGNNDTASSIVIGRNNIGGIIGVNSTNGDMEISYKIISGKVLGVGDCVGGLVGLNLSPEIFTTPSNTPEQFSVEVYQIHGRNMVGGIIGANVVYIPTNNQIKMRVSSNNRYATIDANSVAGGLIGYNRVTSTPININELNTNTDTWYKTFLATDTPGSNQITQSNRIDSSDEHIKTGTGTFSIEGTPKEYVTNTIPILAQTYAGGILGLNDSSSNLTLKYCTNKADVQSREQNEQKIPLSNYIKDSNICKSTTTSMLGGIISYNTPNAVIDTCTNTGSISDTQVIGGIAGLNQGLIYNCKLSDHLGTSTTSFVGGIAAINASASPAIKEYSSDSKTQQVQGTQSTPETLRYISGTINSCYTDNSLTISGKAYVGGLVALNCKGATIENSNSTANIIATQDFAGGILSYNEGGTLSLTQTLGIDKSNKKQSMAIQGRQYIGGLIGMNDNGTLLALSSTGATSDSVTITGTKVVGGLVGINSDGTITTAKSSTSIPLTLTNYARVYSTNGIAGGIAGQFTGKTNAQIENASNYGKISTDNGSAGGIVAENGTPGASSSELKNCHNYQSVTSNLGYAGGISAINYAKITECTVDSKLNNIIITNKAVNECGVLVGINKSSGKISGCSVISNTNPIEMISSGDTFGGMVGLNEGMMLHSQSNTSNTVTTLSTGSYLYTSTGKSRLIVGGVIGRNVGTASNISATNLALTATTNHKYIGGIAGLNQGKIQDSSIETLSIKSNTPSSAGDCVGGITAINGNDEAPAEITNTRITGLKIDIIGYYSATSSMSSSERESASAHIGGIAGKNNTNSTIKESYIDTSKGSTKNNITVTYGMTGGITGFNKGTITGSGSQQTSKTMQIKSPEELRETSSSIASTIAYAPKNGYFNFTRCASATPAGTDNTIMIDNRELTADNLLTSSDHEMRIIIKSSGDLGGLVGYNSVTGALNNSTSGRWWVENCSYQNDAACGGIIGRNSTNMDVTNIVNYALVERYNNKVLSSRFAGGIIGNQENQSSDNWTISNCINYGMLVTINSHYLGGIIGEWSYNGGTVENCINKGNMQTTYQEGWHGTAAGIVSIMYHSTPYQSLNVVSCENYGSAYLSQGNKGYGANDSSGIVGDIIPYESDTAESALPVYINVTDCINHKESSIWSYSMASGIVGFLSSENATVSDKYLRCTQNIFLNIDRCRNYSSNLWGNSSRNSGIFGDRYYGYENTTITNCFSIASYSSTNGSDTYTCWPISCSYGFRDTSKVSPQSTNNFYIIRESDGTASSIPNRTISANGSGYNLPNTATNLTSTSNTWSNQQGMELYTARSRRLYLGYDNSTKRGLAVLLPKDASAANPEYIGGNQDAESSSKQRQPIIKRNLTPQNAFIDTKNWSIYTLNPDIRSNQIASSLPQTRETPVKEPQAGAEPQAKQAKLNIRHLSENGQVIENNQTKIYTANQTINAKNFAIPIPGYEFSHIDIAGAKQDQIVISRGGREVSIYSSANGTLKYQGTETTINVRYKETKHTFHLDYADTDGNKLQEPQELPQVQDGVTGSIVLEPTYSQQYTLFSINGQRVSGRTKLYYRYSENQYQSSLNGFEWSPSTNHIQVVYEKKQMYNIQIRLIDTLGNPLHTLEQGTIENLTPGETKEFLKETLVNTQLSINAQAYTLEHIQGNTTENLIKLRFNGDTMQYTLGNTGVWQQASIDGINCHVDVTYKLSGGKVTPELRYFDSQGTDLNKVIRATTPLNPSEQTELTPEQSYNNYDISKIGKTPVDQAKPITIKFNLDLGCVQWSLDNMQWENCQSTAGTWYIPIYYKSNNLLEIGKILFDFDTADGTAPTSDKITDTDIKSFYTRYIDANTVPSTPYNITTEIDHSQSTATSGKYVVKWDCSSQALSSNSVAYYILNAYQFDTAEESLQAISKLQQGIGLPALANAKVVAQDRKFLNREGNFTLGLEPDKHIIVTIQAVNSCGSSGLGVTSSPTLTAKTLPTPSIAINFTNNNGKLAYNIHIEQSTIDSYNTLMAGTDSKWEVIVTLGDKSVHLDNTNSSKIVELSYGRPYTYSLNAQAISITGTVGTPIMNSGVYSTQCYLPNAGITTATLIGEQPLAKITKATCEVHGTSIKDSTYTVKLTSTGSYTIAPIYRVELVKEIDGVFTTLAYSDISAVSNSTATVTFSNLPETILTDKGKVYARWWYAGSGLGPVYSYKEVINKADANITYLSPDNSLTYFNSTVFDPNVKAEFVGEQYTTQNGGYYGVIGLSDIAILPKPVLSPSSPTEPISPDPMNVGTGENSHKYSISWDTQSLVETTYGKGSYSKPTGGAAYSKASYNIGLYGITKTVNPETQEVTYGESIIASANNVSSNTLAETNQKLQEYGVKISIAPGGTGYTLTTDADAWSYTSIRLYIERIGSEDSLGNTNSIGYKVSGEWMVYTRLTQLALPTIKLQSQNYLKYTLQWGATSLQEPTSSYIVFLEAKDSNNKAEEIKCIGSGGEILSTLVNGELNPQALIHANEAPTIPGTGTSPTKKPELTITDIDLETYSEYKLSLYVVAIPEERTSPQDTPYTYSLNSLKRDITIPIRLKQPIAYITAGWAGNTGSSDYVTEQEMLHSKLALRATVLEEQGALSGSYLLGGYLYDTYEKALETYTTINQLITNPLQGLYIRNKALMGFIGNTNKETDTWRIKFGFDPALVMSASEENSATPKCFDYDLTLTAENTIETNKKVGLDLTMAGQYIVPLIRSASDNEVGSIWAPANTLEQGGILKLPRVILNTPEISISNTITDMPDSQTFVDPILTGGDTTLYNVKAYRTIAEFNTDKYADYYDLNVQLYGIDQTKHVYHIDQKLNMVSKGNSDGQFISMQPIKTEVQPDGKTIITFIDADAVQQTSMMYTFSGTKKEYYLIKSDLQISLILSSTGELSGIKVMLPDSNGILTFNYGSPLGELVETITQLNVTATISAKAMVLPEHRNKFEPSIDYLHTLN